MSFSGLVQEGLKDVYLTLPRTVGVASVSAGLSYLASRATTRVSLPNPLAAAKFTAAITLVQVIARTFKNNFSSDKLSNYAVLGSGIYGANALLNTDGTIKTAATLGSLTQGSQFLYDRLLSKHVRKVLNKFSDTSKYSSRNPSLNTVALEGLKKVYQELPQTIIATAATGFLCRYVSLIGLNPKTAMTFTVATAALRGANAFIEYYFAGEVKGNNLTNTILMSGLTMEAKHHYSHLKIPGYLAIGKAYGIALLAIESSGLLVPFIRDFVK